MKNCLALCIAFIAFGIFSTGIRAQENSATEKPAWVAETNHKCKVWNELYLMNVPKVHYQLWWSGACKNGYASGSGTLQWSVPDKNHPESVPPLVVAQYDGPIVDGKINGKGKISSSSSISYTGDLVDNEPNGYGVESFPSGNRFEGTYSHGYRNGHGTEYGQNGDKLTGEWSDDELKDGFVTYDWGVTGDHFEGYWVNNEPSGHGLFIDRSGKHEGEWKDGELTDGNTTYTIRPANKGQR
jgi:hypothetical protein